MPDPYDSELDRLRSRVFRLEAEAYQQAAEFAALRNLCLHLLDRLLPERHTDPADPAASLPSSFLDMYKNTRNKALQHFLEKVELADPEHAALLQREIDQTPLNFPFEIQH